MKTIPNSGFRQYILVREDDQYAVYDLITNVSGRWCKTIPEAITRQTQCSWQSLRQWRHSPDIIYYFDSPTQLQSDYPELFI